MTDDPFAFDDVTGTAATLSALPAALNERLAARAVRGESPLAAAAELARRGDLRGLEALTGAAAFAAPEDLAVIALAGGAVGADALACVALAPWLAAPSRVAAVEALGRATLTAASYAAVSVAAERAPKPIGPLAATVLADMATRAAGPLRDEQKQLLSVARQVQEGVRGVIHRQELQRRVARGALHPIVGMLTGDDGEFLAGTLPPIDDGAREGLIAPLVTLLRAPNDARRAQVLGLLQRRWREVAAPALSCVARTPLKHKESAVTLAAVRALAAMGALDELAAVVGSGGGPVRAAALAELTKALARGATDVDRALVDAAMRRA
jgi:hypothetical protein